MYDSVILRRESLWLCLLVQISAFVIYTFLWLPKFKHERKNERDSDHSSKMTSSCNWPVEGKIAPINCTTQAYLFFPFYCCFASSLWFSSVTMKYTELFYSNFRTAVCFSTRKTLLYGLNNFFVEWLQRNSATRKVSALQALLKRRETCRETHSRNRCGFYLDYHFNFLHVKNIVRHSDWISVSFFHAWETSFAPLIGYHSFAYVKFTT